MTDETYESLTRRVAELMAQNRRISLESAAQAIELRRRDEKIRILKFRAEFERLTGLMTRDFFEDKVDEELRLDQSRRSLDPSRVNVLAMLDIDGFKTINDTCGHPTGDKLLSSLGHSIRSGIREKDFAARFGGDEFAILFRGIPDEEIADGGSAVQIAERKIIAIRDRFEKLSAPSEEYEEGGHEDSLLHVSFSYGIAVESEELNSFAAMYQDADQALYRQKRERRNLVR